MWISDKWSDYELIDASRGERLERWGDQILIRPDPQIIWDTERTHPGWKKADAIYRRSGGGGSWVKKDVPESWNVGYGGMTFTVRPMGFKHTGVFPEQAVNWDFCRDIVSRAKAADPDRTVSVLNLFGYTGCATVACASAAASVCHVDAAKGMVAAAKENMRLSGLEDAPCRYIVDDCMKFVAREIRRGRKYDAVIMDPPSYGRGPGGEVWKLEDSAFGLISLVAGVLTDDPLFFIINSYSTGLSPSTMGYMLAVALGDRARGGALETGEIGLPVSTVGLPLPCGGAARFYKKF